MESESSHYSLDDAIPILFKRPIDQRQPYRSEDFKFDTNFDLIIYQAKLNKDPQQVIIKTLHIKKKQLIASYQKIPLKRIMHLLGPRSSSNFLFLNFDIYKTQKKYAKQLLSSQILINKEKYTFFGYSKSNLKKFSCFFYKGSQTEISHIFQDLGNFNQIYQVSKKAARLSMLYTEAKIATKLEDNQIRVIGDVERDGHCFTDGCGYVSLDLARKVKRYLMEEQKQEMDYLPAVYQVRIKGIKGIVVINPEYEGEQLIARQSMEKFKAHPNKLNELIIINHSKPSYFASINQQIIMLLDGLGIKSDYFLKLQQNYLQLLKKAIESPMNHIDLLMYLGEDQKIQKFIKNQANDKKKQSMVRSLVSQQIFRNIRSKEMKNRLKIPLSNARFLYGATFPEMFNNKNKKIKLEKRQIFLRVTTAKGVVQTIVGKVIVTKNPCYFCGDVRILEAVDIPEEEIPFSKKLVDVIIFSTEGKSPVGSTMAGSDYDGDQYFVCWDQNLIPQKQVKPYSYPATKPHSQKEPVTQLQLINHLVNFDRFIVSRINSRYLEFATHSRDGAQSPQCVELGTELFSKAIDAANTGQKVFMPEHLNCFIYEESMDGEPVWVEMARNYQSFFDEQMDLDSGLTSGWKVKYGAMEEFVRNYVQRKEYSEYQLFRIIKSWYLSTKCSKYELFEYVDFSQLETKHKREVKQLPNFPPEKYFGNPFERSVIFSHYLFCQIGIQFHQYEETPKKWRHYYTTTADKFDFTVLSEALTSFNNVLIGVQFQQKVSLVFSITQMKKKCYSENYFSDGSFKVYYLGFGELHKFHDINLEQKQYKLFYDDQLFQVYEKDKSNSFIWFKNQLLSIDLSRLDRNLLRKHRINKQPLQSLQIYVGLSENYQQVQTKKLYVTQPPQKDTPIQNNKEFIPHPLHHNKPYQDNNHKVYDARNSKKQYSNQSQYYDGNSSRYGKNRFKKYNKEELRGNWREEHKNEQEMIKVTKRTTYVQKESQKEQQPKKQMSGKQEKKPGQKKGQQAQNIVQVLSEFLQKF